MVLISFPKMAMGQHDTSGSHFEFRARSEIEALVASLAELAGLPRGSIVAVGETSLAELKTRPGYAITRGNTLIGFIEVKAPEKGADPRRFHEEHDKERWAKLRPLPNLIYTDGNGFNVSVSSVPKWAARYRAPNGRIRERLPVVIVPRLIAGSSLDKFGERHPERGGSSQPAKTMPGALDDIEPGTHTALLQAFDVGAAQAGGVTLVTRARDRDDPGPFGYLRNIVHRVDVHGLRTVAPADPLDILVAGASGQEGCVGRTRMAAENDGRYGSATGMTDQDDARCLVMFRERPNRRGNRVDRFFRFPVSAAVGFRRGPATVPIVVTRAQHGDRNDAGRRGARVSIQVVGGPSSTVVAVDKDAQNRGRPPLPRHEGLDPEAEVFPSYLVEVVRRVAIGRCQGNGTADSDREQGGQDGRYRIAREVDHGPHLSSCISLRSPRLPP